MFSFFEFDVKLMLMQSSGELQIHKNILHNTHIFMHSLIRFHADAHTCTLESVVRNRQHSRLKPYHSNNSATFIIRGKFVTKFSHALVLVIFCHNVMHTLITCMAFVLQNIPDEGNVVVIYDICPVL